MKYLFIYLCEKAGVRHFSDHAIRHHVSSRIIDSGKVSERQLQKLLGHQKITTTETYIQDLQID